MKIGNFSSKRVSDIHSDQKISNYTLSLSLINFEKHKVQTLIKSLSSEKIIRSSGCAPPAVDDDAAWHGDGHPDDGGCDDGDDGDDDGGDDGHDGGDGGYGHPDDDGVDGGYDGGDLDND